MRPKVHYHIHNSPPTTDLWPDLDEPSSHSASTVYDRFVTVKWFFYESYMVPTNSMLPLLNGDNYVMRKFIIYTAHDMLLAGWSMKEVCDGRSMRRAETNSYSNTWS